jgi:hypothetical protein
MAVDNALHDGQPYAGSLVLLSPVQPLEHAEQLVGVLHVEAGAIIFDVVSVLAVELFPANFDLRRVTLAGELERIAQQVGEDLPQERGVGVAGWEIVDSDINLSPILLRA